ncbi:ATP-dependent DNA helicase PIF1-like protein [Tanacetum coccineum]
MLSSSFTGRPRYMKQNYMDAMALCIWYGCSDLFITITCNPNWPEIARYMEAHNLSAIDRPDVMSRVFKIKLDQLMKDLKDLRLFGLVYTVEFQKRGLPHAHICLFLHKDDKMPSVDQIDKYISAEIPDKNEDLNLYKLVSDFMMHGPCGEDDPTHVCMANGKCPDRVSARLYETFTNEDGQQVKIAVDEIKAFYDCRYLSACEAAWRIFGFETHYRTPFVERLSFHLSGNQTVLYDENSDLETVMHKPSVDQSRFEGWMKMNELYPKARELAYAEFPTKYVWNAPKRIRVVRKQRRSIGRIYSVPISTGDAYYCRMLLNSAKGCRTYDEIKKVNGVVYPTYKEACYASGLLEDDKEYVDSIKDTAHWAPPEHLRELFVTLLSDVLSQVLLVIPKGSRQDIVSASLKQSYLWDHYDKLGEENDGEVEIDVPEEILIDQADDPVSSIVDFNYPNILDNIHDPSYFKEKAVLAPTNEVVDNINEHLLDKFPGEEMPIEDDNKHKAEGLHFTNGKAEITKEGNDEFYVEKE